MLSQWYGRVTIIVISCLLAAGCQKGMQSVSSQDGNTTAGAPPAPAPEIDFGTIEQDAAEAELALNEAVKSVDKLIKKDGSLRVFSTTSEVETQILEIPLKKVLDKVIEKVSKINDVFDKAQAKIDEARKLLDPNNPLHQAALARLDELQARLDQVKDRADQGLEMLASKIDLVLEKIDDLTARLSPTNPLHLIILFEVENIKGVIRDFQTQLGAILD